MVMNDDSLPCDLVSWDRSYRLARDLADNIKSSGYRPDLVIAIGRGGYVPARVVCDFLLHNLLTSMKVEHWGIAAQKKDKAQVRFPLAVDVRGQKVLIVDDVTDTGDTLQIAVSYVEGFAPQEIKTGVLQHKTTSSFEPDYYAEKITQWKWIIYPWAVHEDLVGFVEKVLSEDLVSLEAVGAELARRYLIVVDVTELEGALEDLSALGKAEKKGSLYRIATG